MVKGKASMMLMANEAAKRKAGGRAQRRRDEAMARKQEQKGVKK
jgi:hypothetical protein